jgi:hypothetical protein
MRSSGATRIRPGLRIRVLFRVTAAYNACSYGFKARAYCVYCILPEFYRARFMVGGFCVQLKHPFRFDYPIFDLSMYFGNGTNAIDK